MVKEKRELEPENGGVPNFLLYGILFSLFYWLLEALRDSFVFHRGSIISRFFSPDPMSFWMRILVIFFIILFSIRAQSILQKMLEENNEKLKKRYNLFRVGLTLGIIYWVLESFRDAFIFDKGSFIERILMPDHLGLWMRLLAIFVLLLFGLFSQSIVDTHRKIELVLRKKQEKTDLEYSLSKILLAHERAQRIQAEKELNQIKGQLQELTDKKESFKRFKKHAVNPSRVKKVHTLDNLYKNNM
jgi:hypothetical protein